MKLIITKHARAQMSERGIDEEQIKTVIKRGAKTKQTDGFLSVYTYIKIAYKIKGDKYIIKTVMVQD